MNRPWSTVLVLMCAARLVAGSPGPAAAQTCSSTDYLQCVREADAILKGCKVACSPIGGKGLCKLVCDANHERAIAACNAGVGCPSIRQCDGNVCCLPGERGCGQTCCPPCSHCEGPDTCTAGCASPKLCFEDRCICPTYYAQCGDTCCDTRREVCDATTKTCSSCSPPREQCGTSCCDPANCQQCVAGTCQSTCSGSETCDGAGQCVAGVLYSGCCECVSFADPCCAKNFCIVSEPQSTVDDCNAVRGRFAGYTQCVATAFPGSDPTPYCKAPCDAMCCCPPGMCCNCPLG